MFTNYDGDLRIFYYKFDKACFWIRICGLPLGLMNEETVELLGRKIGELKSIDKNSSRSGANRSLRVRIEIDINKPLRRFVSLTVKGWNEVLRGRFKYERLPIFCYNCGIIGQSEVECDKEDPREKNFEVVQQ